MKKFPCRIFATLCCGLALVATSNAATLVTHYDFEGGASLELTDKAILGVTADTLTKVGTVTIESDSGGGLKSASTVANLRSANNGLTSPHSLDTAMSDSFSIAVWIKYDTEIHAQEDFNAVISKRTGSGSSNYWMGQGEIGTSNDAFRVSFDYSGGNIPGLIQYPESSYVETDWHHYVMVFDNAADTLKFYLDGVLTATSSGVTQVPVTTTAPFSIGRRGDQNNDFDGWVDDVRLYKGVLTDGEIYSLAVPEPTASALAALAGLAVVSLRRRK